MMTALFNTRVWSEQQEKSKPDISFRKLLVCLLPFGIALIAADAMATKADEIQAGKIIYESRCLGCHTVEANNIGPRHANVFGRKAGSIADFEYSPALRNARIVWNEKTLDRWLQDPEAYIPGQQMDVSVSKDGDRKNLIAYLKTLSTKSSKLNKP
ncbi:cytochrome c family protein [Undibacterium sp. YM2]|uniref:c-type cytochrome n=1 Tax=Undibacterium sp. YM2 TaxID=2058625 RepID=UPI0013898BFE|nr:c-type cytochrome [Undibacterium sp. YM2]